MADREVNDDILPEEQPHEEQQDDDIEIEADKTKKCKNIYIM